MSEKRIKCANCKKEFDYFKSEFRPFCTERCKQIDLGSWLTENYALPSKEPLSEYDIESIIKEKYSEKD